MMPFQELFQTHNICNPKTLWFAFLLLCSLGYLVNIALQNNIQNKDVGRFKVAQQIMEEFELPDLSLRSKTLSAGIASLKPSQCVDVILETSDDYAAMRKTLISLQAQVFQNFNVRVINDYFMSEMVGAVQSLASTYRQAHSPCDYWRLLEAGQDCNYVLTVKSGQEFVVSQSLMTLVKLAMSNSSVDILLFDYVNSQSKSVHGYKNIEFLGTLDGQSFLQHALVNTARFKSVIGAQTSGEEYCNALSNSAAQLNSAYYPINALTLSGSLVKTSSISNNLARLSLSNQQHLLDSRKPFVSVIIPYYNNEMYLRESLDCLERQSLSDMEVILIDDGSNQKSHNEMISIVSSYKTDIKVWTQKNHGLSYSRNIGVLMAQGEFIIFFDPDDLINSTTLEKLALKLTEYNDVSFVYPGSVHFGEYNFKVMDEYDGNRLQKENYLPSFAMIRRQDYINAGGMDETFEGWEDYDFWLRLRGMGKPGRILREELFYYRRHKNGMTGQIVKKNPNEQHWLAELKKRNPQAFGLPLTDGAFSLGRLDVRYAKQYNISFGDRHLSAQSARLLAEQQQAQSTFDYQTLRFRVSSNNKHFRLCSNQTVVHVLYNIPYMVVGGSEKVDLDIIEAMHQSFKSHYSPEVKFHVTIVTETDWKGHEWFDKFAKFADDIFHLDRVANGWEGQLRLVEYLIYSRQVDVVFVRNGYTGYNLARMMKNRGTQVKFVDLVHLYTNDYSWDSLSAPFHQYLDKRVVISQDLRRHMNVKYQLPEKDFTIIDNGIDLNLYNRSNVIKIKQKNFRTWLGIPVTAKVVAFIGRVDSEKDPEKWIRIASAIKQMNNATYFLVVGSGNKLEAMQALAKQVQLEHVFFLGYQDKVEEIIVEIDLLLMTSIFEGIPFTAVQCLAMGVPVVSSNVGAFREIVNDHVNGQLLDVNDSVENYASAVIRNLDLVISQDNITAIRTKFDKRRMQENYRSLMFNLAQTVDKDKKYAEFTQHAAVHAFTPIEY
ncbi:hypothetical protein MP228_012906 [Amoeboaphelidium protococcarum]|nr:hypothetical protein MP228_012906 [Amoeboaphelidium protococcarum]